MPEFVGIEGWLNAPKNISKKSFEGRVLLLFFWNYSETRAFKTIKVLDYWQSKYGEKGFTVAGIHSPAFDFEKIPVNVRKAVKQQGIAFPVALDPARSLWGIYNVQNSPAYVLIDSRGRIRENSADISYERMEQSIRALLIEKGGTLMTSIDPAQFPEKTVAIQDHTFGSRILTGYGNSEKLRSGVAQSFIYPQNFSIDFFYLQGNWTFYDDKMEVSKLPASLAFKTNASRVYLVAGSKRESPLPVEILIDGKPLQKSEKGPQVKIKGGKSYLFIQDSKSYEILKGQKRGYRDLELRFEDSGAQLYRVSFE